MLTFLSRMKKSFTNINHIHNYICCENTCLYSSKTCVKWPLSKRPKIGFQDQLSLNAGQKYCRMLQVEHSAILLTFIKLPIFIKIFVLSIFEWPFYTGFTVRDQLVYLSSSSMVVLCLGCKSITVNVLKFHTFNSHVSCLKFWFSSISYTKYLLELQTM